MKALLALAASLTTVTSSPGIAQCHSCHTQGTGEQRTPVAKVGRRGLGEPRRGSEAPVRPREHGWRPGWAPASLSAPRTTLPVAYFAYNPAWLPRGRGSSCNGRLTSSFRFRPPRPRPAAPAAPTQVQPPAATLQPTPSSGASKGWEAGGGGQGPSAAPHGTSPSGVPVNARLPGLALPLEGQRGGAELCVHPGASLTRRTAPGDLGGNAWKHPPWEGLRVAS